MNEWDTLTSELSQRRSSMMLFWGMQLKGEVKLPRERCFCEACFLGKQARLPVFPSAQRSSKCGELIHFDTCAPMSVESPGGSRWLAVFVDDYSGYLFVYPMRNKSDIL